MYIKILYDLFIFYIIINAKYSLFPYQKQSKLKDIKAKDPISSNV
jgi:hypothetical protein